MSSPSDFKRREQKLQQLEIRRTPDGWVISANANGHQTLLSGKNWLFYRAAPEGPRETRSEKSVLKTLATRARRILATLFIVVIRLAPLWRLLN
jgi:hypothetical protein